MRIPYRAKCFKSIIGGGSGGHFPYQRSCAPTRKENLNELVEGWVRCVCSTTPSPVLASHADWLSRLWRVRCYWETGKRSPSPFFQAKLKRLALAEGVVHASHAQAKSSENSEGEKIVTSEEQEKIVVLFLHPIRKFL